MASAHASPAPVGASGKLSTAGMAIPPVSTTPTAEGARTVTSGLDNVYVAA